MASLYTLPNKLLLNVAKFLDKPDLLKLALTCRKFTSIAQDVLYDAPELQDYYSTPITTTIQRIRDLGRTLLRRPDLARKVRELTVVAVDGTHSTIELGTMELAGQILGEIARYSPQLTANVEDWIHRLREGRGVAWVGLILAIAPRLSSLTIEINRGRSTGRWDTKRYAPDPQEHLFGHIATTYDMAVFFPLDLSAIPGLQHLKTLRFHAAELALNWCLLPDLKTLTLPRNCHREFDGSYASRIAPSGIHGCSKVSAMNAELPTSLTRQLDENDYSALSSSFLCSETFPSLRSLHIKLTNAYRWTPSNGILRERAPWPHVRSLQEFDLHYPTVEVLDWFEEVSRNRAHLSRLKAIDLQCDNRRGDIYPVMKTHHDAWVEGHPELWFQVNVNKYEQDEDPSWYDETWFADPYGGLFDI